MHNQGLFKPTPPTLLPLIQEITLHPQDLTPFHLFTLGRRVSPLLAIYQTPPEILPPLIVPSLDRKSTRLNSSHLVRSRMPSSA